MSNKRYHVEFSSKQTKVLFAFSVTHQNALYVSLRSDKPGMQTGQAYNGRIEKTTGHAPRKRILTILAIIYTNLAYSEEKNLRFVSLKNELFITHCNSRLNTIRIHRLCREKLHKRAPKAHIRLNKATKEGSKIT